MHRFILAAAVAAIGAALLATPALAFDPHFYVHQKYRTSHDITPNRFVRQDTLRDPHDRQTRVGRDRFRCRARHGGGTLKCRALVHLNGKIGGKGYIRARGQIHHGDKYLQVFGGTRQFAGVAGRMFWNGSRLQFDLR